MYSIDFQKYMHVGLLSHLRKYPFGHRLIMDNDSKHVSHSTRRYMLINDINPFITPAQSPDLNKLECK